MDSDLEISDVENYVGEKDQQFSHQDLVMRTMRKYIEVACQEMRTGWFNSKTDKHGNTTMQYIDDTRKKLIECVQTILDVMACDLDEEVEEEIKKAKEELKEIFNKLCDEEEEEWKVLHEESKRHRWRNGITFKKGRLNPELNFAQEFIEEEVKTYRKIFKELTKLTQRLDFYKAEFFEA